MEKRADDIIKRADHMFVQRQPVIRMWQAIADNFYPMRADFEPTAASHSMTAPPADWLADSYPTICLRDLSNSIDSMLRDGNWFEMTTGDGEDASSDEARWLWEATRRQRALMGI